MPGSVDYKKLLAKFKSRQFKKLRPAQEATLDLYAKKYATGPRDIAVELPTGAGKTLIALLIGETWLREGKRVAVLTGNKTLARQMEKREARALGISVVRFEGRGIDFSPKDRRKYNRAKAIGIMNYWVYFNQSPSIDPADMLFMDDSHLAEHCLHSLYSVEIGRLDCPELYGAVVKELAERFPGYSVLQDALDPNAPQVLPTELLSFLDQHAVVDRIREIVDTSDELKQDEDLRYRWNRLRDQLLEANWYLSNRCVWFRPYVYPLQNNEYYGNPRQCIYMSATIGDPGDLARRLGTRPIEKLPIPEKHAISTYGRRLVVLDNVGKDEIASTRQQQAIRNCLRVHPKSVWLCSSRADAERIEEAVSKWLDKIGMPGHPKWTLTSLGDEIEEFKKAKKGHLFVAGRFDGMDFKADECHLIVVATVPKAINPQEDFFTAYLRDSGFMLRRLNQRIIQALGRCNRGADDYGVYVLCDERFVTHFGRESNRQGIPSNVAAEIDSAEDAISLDGPKYVQRVMSVFKGKFAAYDRELAKHLANAPSVPAAPAVDDSSADEISGWTELFENRNYRKAEEHFEKCSQWASKAGLREVGAFFQWCQAKAAFLQGTRGDADAQNRAIELLRGAIDRGGRSAWFNRLATSVNRVLASRARGRMAVQDEYRERVIDAFDGCLERYGTRTSRFEEWAKREREKLASDKHDELREGLAELGQLLGYATDRPRYKAATDCYLRGVFGNVRELFTIEVKIEHKSGKREISPGDVGQAHNQLTRAEGKYGKRGFTIRGTLVTHLKNIEAPALSSLGELKILSQKTVLGLWDRLLLLLSLYRDEWSVDDVAKQHAAADVVFPKLPPGGWLQRALSTDEAFISSKVLLKEWR